MSETSWYRSEIDLQEIVDEQARKVQQCVDQATLDRAADTLADFGYVKIDGNSRWFELFGTPERSARTMVDMCKGGTFDDCGGCPAALAECKLGDYDALLEWIKEEAK